VASFQIWTNSAQGGYLWELVYTPLLSQLHHNTAKTQGGGGLDMYYSKYLPVEQENVNYYKDLI